MDSYIVVVIEMETNKAHVAAEWECSSDPGELYEMAAVAIAEIVRRIGTTNVRTTVQLTQA